MLCLLGALPEALPARTCRLMHRPGASVLGLCGRAFRHGILLGSLLGSTPLSPLLLLLNNVILNNVNLIDPHLLCMFICMAAFVGRIDRNLRKLMRRLDIKE